MLNLIVWNRTIYLYKNEFGIKLPMKVDMPQNTNQPTNKQTNLRQNLRFRKNKWRQLLANW